LPKLQKRKFYAHYIHEHRQNHHNLTPENQIIKKTVSFAVLLLVVSSINPAGAIFSDSATPYLTEQDIAFNMQQLIATEEGFLVKNLGANGDSVQVERLDFIDHEVQNNEDLATIAQLYQLNPETIVWENNIINVDNVKTGQTLKIPPTNGITHEVKKGETISELVSKYDSNTSKIVKYNRLASTTLKVGQKVFVPDGKRITTSLIADTSSAPTPKSTTKIANLETDINANIPPKGVPPVVKTKDAIPKPNVAPVQGVTGTKKITQDADPKVSPKSAPPTTPAPVSSGDWGMPTQGQVTQGYTRSHYALDIANREKPAIWATSGGTVELAKWNAGPYGNYIIIDHGNGYKTLYAHNEELYVEVGDVVTKGQVIAKMGRTGRVYGATGIHVHYECHLDGVRINPYLCMP
jgi:murein DD-endopeptidase MepM/ murein hydrolase activator NlpD